MVRRLQGNARPAPRGSRREHDVGMSDVDDYLAAVEEPKRSTLLALRATLRGRAMEMDNQMRRFQFVSAATVFAGFQRILVDTGSPSLASKSLATLGIGTRLAVIR